MLDLVDRAEASTREIEILVDLVIKAVADGLSSLKREPPLRLSEWADKNFYISAEGSYGEGRWKTERFQRGIMDCMSNDEIGVVNVMKSARVGYSQMLRAFMGYTAQHKKRNQLFLINGDGPAQQFMRTQVETMIRDVPCVKSLAPWLGKKDKSSTETLKIFNNGKVLHCRGGNAAANYRELSVDTVAYDELAAFPLNVEGEGSPTLLGDTRNEGSPFPKSVRGSTPKMAGTCLMEAEYEASDVKLRFYVPCPHCAVPEPLTFGGKGSDRGITWVGRDPKTIGHLCPHCNVISTYAEMQRAQKLPAARWQSEDGVWLDDDGSFRSPAGDKLPTPWSVGFVLWRAYSPWYTWQKLVEKWWKAQGKPNELRAFANTVLAETYRETGKRADGGVLLERVENYQASPLPAGVVLLTAGVDTQPNRLEGQVVGIGLGEETWIVEKFVLHGDPNTPGPWLALDAQLARIYTRADGVQLRIARACVDTAGANTDAVYKYCQARAPGQVVLGIIGRDGEGKAIIGNPTKTNKLGIDLYPVGTVTAKDVIYGRLALEIPEHGGPVPGFIHFRADICDEAYFHQLTAEEMRLKLADGRMKRTYQKISAGRRNEALDTLVYAMAAFASLGLRIEDLVAAPPPPPERQVRGQMVPAGG